MRQHLRTLTRQPDVIMIEETHIDSVTLPGYQPFIPSDASRRLCTFVRNRITAIEHSLHPSSAKVRSRFLTLFKKALNVAGTNPLVIGGDFNLPHTVWGYGYFTTAAQNLWQDSQGLGHTFITDPMFPTRPDRLTKLLYTETKKQGRAQLLDHLTNKYLPVDPVQSHGSYTGAPIPHWTKI
ncbi:hypothetical protein HPB49_026033 [Dermacentor silvarum]|nr:hypothetical protein HPB49_026033 [Dermacentor silvarum]